MFPIRDDAPRYRTPFITYFLLALNVLVFLFEVSLGPRSRQAFVFQFGVIPLEITGLLGGLPEITLQGALLPVVTSMFLHASWLHLIGNMWALHIFGDNIEDHMGHFRFLLLYLVTGVVASFAHVLFNPYSEVPSVGASGAIAGVMGAYFILYPAARVLTLVPFFFLYFVWLPAWLVLGYWFLIEFIKGTATAVVRSEQTGGGIAFWAHVGGFLAGILLIKLIPSYRRIYHYREW
jgi:membrane associated rhomboid family serine protease